MTRKITFSVKNKYLYMVKRFIDNFDDILYIGTEIRSYANTDYSDVVLIMGKE